MDAVSPTFSADGLGSVASSTVVEPCSGSGLTDNVRDAEKLENHDAGAMATANGLLANADAPMEAQSCAPLMAESQCDVLGAELGTTMAEITDSASSSSTSLFNTASALCGNDCCMY